MAAEQEMQAAYMQVMEQLMSKLRDQAAEIAVERSFDLVLEVSQGSVVYSASSLDITPEVINRYNVAYGQ